MPASGSPQPEPGEKEQRLGEERQRGGKTRRRREKRERADGSAGEGATLGTQTGITSCLVGGDAGQGAGECLGPCSASTPTLTGGLLGPQFPHLSDWERMVRLGWWFPPSNNPTLALSGL